MSSSTTPPRAVPITPRADKPTRAECISCALSYSWLSLLVNAGLGVLKVVVGILSGSRALLASAMYSINDVLSGAVVIISMRVARRPPNERYSYGYGNAEFVAVGIVSTIVTSAVIFLLLYSVIDILKGGHHAPHLIAIPVAIVAMLTNHYLAVRGHCVAKKNKSPVVETAAEHNKADAEGSLLTIIGVGGAGLGFFVIDQIVAVVEILHIVWLAGKLFGYSVRGLMAPALPPANVKVLAEAARSVSGVRAVARLRTRQSGSYVWADVDVEVAADLSIEEATAICRSVAVAVRSALPQEVRCQVKYRVPATEELSGFGSGVPSEA